MENIGLRTAARSLFLVFLSWKKKKETERKNDSKKKIQNENQRGQI